MRAVPAEADFVVVGAGVAGLRAAMELAHAGNVLLLTKRDFPTFKLQDAKSEAAWLTDEDEVTLHLQDTLTAGDGLCYVPAVKALLEEAPERIEELIAWGKPLGSKLVFGQESASTKGRALHAQGESTRREILRILCERTQSLKHFTVVPFSLVTNIQVEDGHVTGVSLLDDKGVPHEVSCSAVLLASGGMGQLYRNTTNPGFATADGVALAFRAGAELSDMEFVQFHPTALHMKKVPRFLLPEILRAEGGYLRNFELNRFMAKYHPLAERAPQQVVLRAIVHEMEVSRAKDPFVYLDLTHMPESRIQKLFPRIYAAYMAHNVDITEDVIPVRPAAHSSMGGVRTDLNGKTNIPGLFAAGDVAVTGLHGANRLPSNSLLESLVYGVRAGRTMRDTAKQAARTAQSNAAYSNGPVDSPTEELIGQIQDLMWNEVGIVRMRAGMQKAVKALEEMGTRFANPKTRRAHEAANLHLAALQVARSALAREESRGAHYRMDYPDHDDKRFLRHSVIRGEKILFPQQPQA